MKIQPWLILCLQDSADFQTGCIQRNIQIRNQTVHKPYIFKKFIRPNRYMDHYKLIVDHSRFIRSNDLLIEFLVNFSVWKDQIYSVICIYAPFPLSLSSFISYHRKKAGFSMYTNTWTGTGIGVAILDTGLYPHIDFGERIRGFQDFLGHRPYPYDDSGHGTHVAGILAGDGTASDRRYQGVAPGCHLVAAKVLDRRGNGRLQDVLRALQWISFNQNLYGIRIINISVGAAAMDSKAAARLIKAVEQAWDQGFVVVTAAGNMGPAYGSVTAPGSSKKVITVGASDMLDRISSVSGAGPTAECVCKPDLVAPGADVISCANKRNSYAIKSGTSMSTPRVSGAIALLLQKDPFLTNVEVKMLLRESCLDLGYPRNRQGWGKLDIQKLLAL